MSGLCTESTSAFVASYVCGVWAARSSWITPQAPWTGEADALMLTVGVDTAAAVNFHMLIQTRRTETQLPLDQQENPTPHPEKVKEAAVEKKKLIQ